MDDIIIKASGIHKTYRTGAKKVCAVDGVSLEIRRGRSLAIVGPSGAGKSTLLHLLGGLDSPTSGKVFIDGADLYRLPDRRRARVRNSRIGFVFQSYHLLPEFTALENVMLPAMIKGQGAGVKGPGMKEKAADVLKSVGLKERASHKPCELSGGESQRVAIARALINEPEILLCDEPTGNLDSRTSESIYELLLDLKSRYTMSLVIVTHNEKISSATDEVIHLKDGRI